MSTPKSIKIDNTEYVRADLAGLPQHDGLPYVIVRSIGAGVFAGYLEKREGKEVTLVNARRLYYWQGAATLSEMAMRGTSKPDGCKFPAAVNRVLIVEAVEILDTTEAARKSIEGVKVWSA